ncbi:MAG: GNAT family N-acetyltransferase [Actinomycetota bacterium]|nr:GNAT family N-acetyltransferase [Actinomycetota bacterium]
MGGSVRRRTSGDVSACLALLHAVHRTDGYPSTVEDAAGFLVPPYEVASWVAVADGAVVGHAALHEPTDSATVSVASRATGLPQDRHVLLSRLFVAPEARGAGLARSLLRTAVTEARRKGQHAVLDVGQDFRAAVALYEAEGWSRVAADRQAVGDEVFDVWVYVAPDAKRAEVPVATEDRR